MYFLRKLYHNVLSEDLSSHHYTLLQSLYRFVNHLIRFILLITLSYTVDASLGITFVVFLLDTLSNQSFLTLVCSFGVILSRLIGAAIYVASLLYYHS